MNLTQEQGDFVEQVARLWASGLTQYEVADKMGKSLSTVRARLASYGLKFARNGKIIPIRANHNEHGHDRRPQAAG